MMQGVLVSLLLACLATSCKVHEDCRPGTVFVSLPCPDGEQAGTWALDVSGVAGASYDRVQLPAKCPTTTVQLNVPRYAGGGTARVTAVFTSAAGAPPVQRTAEVPAGASCTAVPVTAFAAATADGGGVLAIDGAASDARDGAAGPEADAACAPSPGPAGSGCGCDAQCASGICVDGICCDRRCDGTCEACDVSGKLGTCTFVPDGVAPKSPGQCAAEPASTCGRDGLCDGAGACRKHPDGTICQAGRCEGATIVDVKQCTAGMCKPAATTMCAPFGCDPAASRCFATCAGDAQCATGQHCNQLSCGLKPLGAVCAAKGECASGFCADGVCCSSACDGACTTCKKASALGTCTAVAAGVADPHRVCQDAGAKSCGQTGACTANGQCELRDATATCGAESCDATTNRYTALGHCSGTGTCVAATTTTCPNLLTCGGIRCKATCDNTMDCVAGAYCAAGACATCPAVSSLACSAASKCALWPFESASTDNEGWSVDHGLPTGYPTTTVGMAAIANAPSGGGHALKVHYTNNASSAGTPTLVIKTNLCGTGTNLTGKKLSFRMYFTSAVDPLGDNTGVSIETFNGSQCKSGSSVPYAIPADNAGKWITLKSAAFETFSEGGLGCLGPGNTQLVTQIAIGVRIDQTWDGDIYFDDIQVVAGP